MQTLLATSDTRAIAAPFSRPPSHYHPSPKHTTHHHRRHHADPQLLPKLHLVIWVGTHIQDALVKGRVKAGCRRLCVLVVMCKAVVRQYVSVVRFRGPADN